jgi:hypothetical protein
MKTTDSKIEYDPIPETVQDALTKWDSGESLFSISMGGLGPGYEMAIQGLAFELMREVNGFTQWDDEKECKSIDVKLEPIITDCNKKPWGGFSGAQVGAAKSLASIVCRKGYRKALRMDAVKDRLIQVCRKDLRSNGTLGK